MCGGERVSETQTEVHRSSRRFNPAEFRGPPPKGHSHQGRRKGSLAQPITQAPADHTTACGIAVEMVALSEAADESYDGLHFGNYERLEH